MKPKIVLSKGNRILLFVLQQLVAIIVAISITTIVINGRLKIGGYEVFLNPLEYDTEFEKSDIYRSLLQKGIRDAVRMSVIKSQLETDGEFDGTKIIDVTAYVNRAEQLSGKYVTARYQLEDLLKWGKYGFEYTGKVFDSLYEMNSFLAEETTYTQYEGTYTTGFHPVQEESELMRESLWADDEGSYITYYDNEGDTVEYEIFPSDEGMKAVVDAGGAADSENEEVTDDGEEGKTSSATVVVTGEEEEAAAWQDTYQTVMTNRYRTADNKTPEELVSRWDEYYGLCKNIAVAAESLYYNYREYLDYENSYNAENSNLLYCMVMMVDGENVCFTNATLPELNLETINSYFGNFKNSIYYSPYDMEYHTTTGVSEDYFLSLMEEYGYAYTENTKIWIAVDDKYFADDDFAKAQYTFTHLLPSWWKYAACIIGGIGAWVVLLVLLSFFTGRKVVIEGDENTDELVEVYPSRFETIPTEIWLLLCGMAAGILVVMVLFTRDMVQWKKMHNGTLLNIAATETFIVSSVGCLIFYSFIRRCKSHTLWRYSFTSHLFGWLRRRVFAKMSDGVKTVYWNMPIVLRTLVPYCGLMLVNAAGMLLILTKSRKLGLLTLVCLGMADAAVGWMLFKRSVDNKKIVDGIGEIRNGDLNYQVDTDRMYGENKILAEAVNSIGDGIRQAVETSMKDERMKADLITNVSHDIKTPLTSIINYVDLLKREAIKEEKIRNYIEILDAKSQRLKQLTDDLVEASKISSGNIVLNIEKINIVELLNQAIGEFSEKFDTKDLQMVVAFEKRTMCIEADSRRMWRVIENLFNNIFKYAMAGTRVYIDGKEENGRVVLSVKNISAQPLNINADELTERFIRGDVSRSTEGSGLGLSIAKNLTEVQNGKFDIYLDGDLFKAILSFPVVAEEAGSFGAR